MPETLHEQSDRLFQIIAENGWFEDILVAKDSPLAADIYTLSVAHDEHVDFYTEFADEDDWDDLLFSRTVANGAHFLIKNTMYGNWIVVQYATMAERDQDFEEFQRDFSLWEKAEEESWAD